MDKRIETVNKTGRPTLCCPICGDDSGLHILRVDVGTDKNTTSITSGGTFVSNSGHDGRWKRGSRTTLMFDCEMCCHKSKIHFSFHKGQIMIDIDDLGTKNDKRTSNKDIWRD